VEGQGAVVRAAEGSAAATAALAEADLGALVAASTAGMAFAKAQYGYGDAAARARAALVTPLSASTSAYQGAASTGAGKPGGSAGPLASLEALLVLQQAASGSATSAAAAAPFDPVRELGMSTDEAAAAAAAYAR
jgi:hypothetical protein